MGVLEVSLFVGLTGLAVVASLHSWRADESYGFFRFFGFESIAALVAWNSRAWFQDPFSAQQILSWALLLGSAGLAAHGFYLLRKVGRAQRRVMEETEVLVQAGVYRFIRHPLYASLLLLGWGAFLKRLDWTGALLALGGTFFWIATAGEEERFNTTRFGERYQDYVRRTKMFVPFIF